MKISEKIAETFESWSEAWKERLRGWLKSVIGLGIESFMDVLGGKLSEELRPLIKKLEETTEIPPELSPLFDEIKNPTGEAAAALGARLGGSVVGGLAGRFMDWILRPAMFASSYNPTFHLHDPEILLAVMRRNNLGEDWMIEQMRYYGWSDQHTKEYIKVSELRFPSEIVAPLWLRNPERWGMYWDDVKELGVDPGRILALQELAYKMPTPQDLITFTAHEVFEEDMVKTYGLDEEFDKVKTSLFDQVGIRPEHVKMYWRSHWVHPSYTQMAEMLHRGIFTEEEMKEWFRLVEIPPHWRDGLIETAWNVPNRIELRMMARYGLVDKAFLVEALKKAGMAEEYRDIAADMMLVLGIRTDLATRYSKGWLNKQTLGDELRASGLAESTQTRLYQYIVKNEGPARTSNERDLTAAEIIRGVKKGVLSRADGMELLVDMGYDEEEALFKLAVDAPEDTVATVVTQRELTKTETLAALKAGTMTEPNALERLKDLRYSQGDAEIILSIYRSQVKPPTEERGRQASKADIVKAVKGGLITPENGYLMLIDLDFEPAAAEFILLVQAEESPFSPKSFDEFKELTGIYRQTLGLETVEASPEVRELRRRLTEAEQMQRTPALEARRVQVDTIRRRRRAETLTRQQEINELVKLGIDNATATAYADNDDARLESRRR